MGKRYKTKGVFSFVVETMKSTLCTLAVYFFEQVDHAEATQAVVMICMQTQSIPQDVLISTCQVFMHCHIANCRVVEWGKQHEAQMGQRDFLVDVAGVWSQSQKD